jgi:hypothetical protein
MATVYLPMGYPIQSGNAFQNVIYQGSVVRLYTLPKDPRSDAQLQERRFLSDVTKTKKCLGLWAKGACRAVFGTSWGTVIYQIIKADVEGWWSGALAEWESFGEVNQDAWRAASPYQATFNDVGEIFFGLTRVIAQALNFYSGIYWGSELWTETESAAALAWWQKDLMDAILKGTYEETYAGLHFSVSWDTYTDGNWHGGGYKLGNFVYAGSCYFYFYARGIIFGYGRDNYYGNMKVSIDGVQVGLIDQHNNSPIYQVYSTFDTGVKRLHYAKLEVMTNLGNVDWIQVF